MSGRLNRLLERPPPLGLPIVALAMVTVALCPPAVRLALLALSALGSLAFAMTQFWFERRPRWMRAVQFDRSARRSWWVLLLLALLTAVLWPVTRSRRARWMALRTPQSPVGCR